VLGLVYLALALTARLLGGSVGFNASAVTPLGLSILELTLFLLPTGIAAALMARIEHRKFGGYGLPAKFAFRKDFWIGTSIGFLAISASLLGIFALHGFRLTGLATRGTEIVGATAAWAATFVIVGLSEEFAFRGYLQFTLTTGIGFWPSAVLMSLLFGFVHSGNPGESKFGLFSVVLFGLLFCLFLRRTGNLWWAVGFHSGWDWGQTFFYGVPDSGIVPYHNLFSCAFSGPSWLTGGTVGPEASIFTPTVLAIVAILFTCFYRENRYAASLALSAPHQFFATPAPPTESQ
jgi:membrane protease YdiL (CAAX protease family)